MLEIVSLKTGQKMINVLDTNIILRYLVDDDNKQHKKAVDIFKKAEAGTLELLIKVVVVAETCFVLESFYKRSLDEIATSMEVFLSQKWLKVEDRKGLLAMWTNYRNKLHFVDSYLLSTAKENKYKILTFDKDIEKIEANN